MADRTRWSRGLLRAAAVTLVVAAPLGAPAAQTPAAPAQRAAPAPEAPPGPRQGNVLLAVGAGVLIGVAVLVVLAAGASD